MEYDQNLKILEIIEIPEKDEAAITKRLAFPIKDGVKEEKGNLVFCIIDGKVVSGIVLNYVKLKIEATMGESTYQFFLPAHRVRLSDGKNIEHATIFHSEEDAKKYLDKINSGKPTVYKIEKIDTKIMEPIDIPREIPSKPKNISR